MRALLDGILAPSSGAVDDARVDAVVVRIRDLVAVETDPQVFADLADYFHSQVDWESGSNEQKAHCIAIWKALRAARETVAFAALSDPKASCACARWRQVAGDTWLVHAPVDESQLIERVTFDWHSIRFDEYSIYRCPTCKTYWHKDYNPYSNPSYVAYWPYDRSPNAKAMGVAKKTNPYARLWRAKRWRWAVGISILGLLVSSYLQLNAPFAKFNPHRHGVVDWQGFKTWRSDFSIVKIRSIDANQYLVVVLNEQPNLWILPSGPSAYVFDRRGKLIDWAADIGDNNVFDEKWQAQGHAGEIAPTEVDGFFRP